MTLSSVDQAVEQIVLKGSPLGVGIDAPLWWSTRIGAGRKADHLLVTSCVAGDASPHRAPSSRL